MQQHISLKTQNDPSFLKISLKLEDKVLLGIGALFCIFILIFIGFANKILNTFEEPDKKWKDSYSAKKTEKDDEFGALLQQSFRESEEAFYRLAKVFEENNKKREESFNRMEKNFKERFKKAMQDNSRMERIYKSFDESAKESDREFEKKVASFGASLPKYAIAKKQGIHR